MSPAKSLALALGSFVFFAGMVIGLFVVVDATVFPLALPPLAIVAFSCYRIYVIAREDGEPHTRGA